MDAHFVKVLPSKLQVYHGMYFKLEHFKHSSKPIQLLLRDAVAEIIPLFFETGSHSVAWAQEILFVILWRGQDYRHTPWHPVYFFIIKM
jgi:hypothetical protein